jgi:actin related protein 2/3 complex subunit 2
MILLEFANVIIADTLRANFSNSSEKPETIDLKFSDFDGVLYSLSNLDNKNLLKLSLSWRCFGELKSFGAEDILKKVYGDKIVAPQAGFDFTIQFDLSNLPANKEELIQSATLLKRHALAAPFVKAFEAQEKGQTTDLMQIHYRDNEAIYVKAEKDRVTVLFSTTFKDETDVIFGKVFLQEFVDARRSPALQNSPQVLFYPRDPPVELQGVKGLQSGDNVGYVTFVLFPRHISKENREKTISLIQTFRDYLHYHIKCSKAYMHSRMRARVTSLLKVLNRAKPDIPVEKKTFSGKTFKKF